uniref:Coatomer subunit delta n=1 Tax=Setaria digitata TaxID=48799 RepID=A0A915PC13_9BILA
MSTECSSDNAVNTGMAVSNVKEKYADFLVDGVKAVSLTFVSDVGEMAEAQKYHPEYVYQQFGESETIFGYKDLNVTIHYTDASMYLYPEIRYAAEITSFTTEFKADNIIQKLSEQLPIDQMEMLCQTSAIFKFRLDEQKNFRPYGQLLSKFSVGNRELQVWMINESSPAFDAYLARVQTLALWYIEAAQYTDNDDPRWQHYFLYESFNTYNGISRVALAGYASLVRFYNYPDKVRPRIAQILLLPQYHGAGIGARFLKAIYSDLIQDPKVIDITAEVPAESFIKTRDYVNCSNCSTLKEFHADNLRKGFTEEMKNAALLRFKINPRQARRVYEILRLHHIGFRDEKAMEEYRIDRSERDWRKLSSVLDEYEYAAVVASQMSVEQKTAKLQQLYEEELAGYRTVIKRLINFPNGFRQLIEVLKSAKLLSLKMESNPQSHCDCFCSEFCVAFGFPLTDRSGTDMVLIGAAIITKAGKPLLARVFISDMTKARLEGLLDAFPKLIASYKSQRQHTFIETDSVRYVFHPLDSVHVVLITTKASNILEDLETLRLFSRVIPEYCRSNDEKEIQTNLFDLIFAFDEIVALGYRENVNLAQIRTFTEMDSHEERVFNQIKIAQERAANELMTQKAMELKKLKAEQRKSGRGLGNSATAISSASLPLTAVIDDTPVRLAIKPKAPVSARGSGKALKLGSKNADDDQFLKQLKREGQLVDSPVRASDIGNTGNRAVSELSSSAISQMPVHIKIEERLSVSVSRDGGLESGEVLGSASLLIGDPQFTTVCVQISNNDKHGAQLQVHPNLDKKEWQQNSLLKLKSVQKPFPLNMDVGVLKWRLLLNNEEILPISINCWPNENPDGCVVNIEYTLQAENMALNNVVITIPLPPAAVPVVSECEGIYEYMRSRSQLVWSLPVIDESNKSGSLEFSTPNGQANHFFPVIVRFTSTDLFCNMAVESVQKMDASEMIQYSTECRLISEKFEIV